MSIKPCAPLPKTGVGRVTYALSPLPSLLIWDVKVQQCESGKEIYSRKLRYRAISEFLDIWGNTEYRNEFGIDVRYKSPQTTKGSRTDRFDHLVLEAATNGDSSDFVSELDLPIELKLEKTKFIANYSEEKDVKCTAIGSCELVLPSATEVYRQSLDILMRTRLSNEMEEERVQPFYHAEKDFPRSLPGDFFDPFGRDSDIPLLPRHLDRFSTVT
jgi:hypothetical protein